MQGTDDTETPVKGDEEGEEVGGVEEAGVNSHHDQAARLPVLAQRGVRQLHQAVHPAGEHRQQEAAVRHRQAGQEIAGKVSPRQAGNNRSREVKTDRQQQFR